MRDGHGKNEVYEGRCLFCEEGQMFMGGYVWLAPVVGSEEGWLTLIPLAAKVE